MQDIHGIRPPVSFGFDLSIIKTVLMMLALILLLLVLFFLVKKIWKRKKQPLDLKYLPAPEPAFEAALKQLDLLFHYRLWNLKAFYFDLTAILRNYIGSSYDINAIEMTSQEFVKSINQLDLESSIKRDVSKFIYLSDSFKYAGIIPEKKQAEKDYQFIKEKIHQIEKWIKESEIKREREQHSVNRIDNKNNSGSET